MTPESERKPPTPSNRWRIPAVHSRLSSSSWLFLLILALTLIAGGVSSLLRNKTSYVGYIWIAAGTGITGIWSFCKKPFHRFPTPVWTARKDAISLLLCCILSVALRAYQLHERPWGLHNDIGWGACMACSALEGGTVPFQSGGYLYGSAYSLVPSFSVLGPSVYSLRLTFAVLGALGTFGVFAFSRLAFGSPMALVAGFLSAVSTFEIAFERYADMPALLIVYGAPMVAFLWWSLSRPSWIAPLLAGLFLALFSTSYLAAKTLGPLFFLVTAAYALVRGPLPRRRLLNQLLLVAASSLVFGFRFFYQAAAHFSQFFLGELNSNIFATAGTTGPWSHLAQNLHDAHAGLMTRSNIVGAFYPGPVIEPLLLVFLFFGLAVLIGRCWDLLSYFCLAAASLAFLPALLGPTFEPRRAIFIGPMLTVLPVAGLAALAVATREALPVKAGRLVSVCLIASVLLTATAYNARTYVRDILPLWGEGVQNRAFGEFLVSLNDKYFVFIDSGVGPIDTAYFLLYAHYRENEYILSKYNRNVAVKPRPGHYRLHDFERDGLPVPPSHDRPVMYVLFRWNQQYDQLVALVQRSLTHVKYRLDDHQLAVPGSSVRYHLVTVTIPIESIDLIKPPRPLPAAIQANRALAGSSVMDQATRLEMPAKRAAAIRAATEGNLDTLRRLLAENPGLVQSADSNGWTLLHLAAGEGRVDVVRLLLGSGAAVDSTDQVGSTPLQKAIYFNRVEVVRALLEHGADPTHRDSFGASAIEYAAGRTGILDVLQSSRKTPSIR